MDARRKPPSPSHPSPSHRPNSSRSSLSEGGLDITQLKARVLWLSISVALGRCLKQSLRLGFHELQQGLAPTRFTYTREKVNSLAGVLETVLTDRSVHRRYVTPEQHEMDYNEEDQTVWIRTMARGLDRRKVRLEVRREHALLSLARKRIRLILSEAWKSLRSNQGLEGNLMLRLAFGGWKGKQRAPPSKPQLRALTRVCTRLRVRLAGKMIAAFYSLRGFNGHQTLARVHFRPHPPSSDLLREGLHSVFSRTSWRHAAIKKVYFRQWGEIASMTASRRCRKQDFYSKVGFVLATVTRRLRYIAWNRLKKAQISRESHQIRRFHPRVIVSKLECEKLVTSLDFLRKSAKKRGFFCLRFLYFREKRAKVTSNLLRRALLPTLLQYLWSIQRYAKLRSILSMSFACLSHGFERFEQRRSLGIWKEWGLGRYRERIAWGVIALGRVKGKIGARLQAETLANIGKTDPWVVSKRTAALKLAALVRYRLRMKAKERLRYGLCSTWCKQSGREIILSPSSSFETQRRGSLPGWRHSNHRLLSLSPVSVPSRASPNSTLDFAWMGEELESIRSTIKKPKRAVQRICFECGSVVRPHCQLSPR